MFKQFLQHGSLYLGTTISARALDILLLPVYTRILDKADFGLLDLVMFPVELVSIIVGLHVTEAVGRLHHATDVREDQVDYATTGLLTELTGHLVFAAFAVAFAAPISSLLTGTEHHVHLVRLGVMMAVSRALIMVVQRQLRWELRATGYALARLSYAAIMNASALLFVYWGWRAAGVIGGHVVAGVLIGLSGILFLRNSFSGKFSWARFVEMCRFSVPLIPHHCSRGLTIFLNRRILLHYHSLGLVGLYGMGARLAMTLDIFMNGIALSVMPLIMAHHEKPETPRQIARIFRYTVAVGIVGFVVYSLFAKEALLIFTTRKYLPARDIVPLVFAGRLFFSLQVFAAGMWIRKKTRLVGLISLIGILLDVVLNLKLVPIFGMMGTAAGTCISGALVFVLSMTFSQKLYPVPHDWGPMLKACLVAAVAVWVGSLAELSLGPGLVIKVLLVLMTVVAVAAFRVVQPDEVCAALLWICRKARPSEHTRDHPG